MFWTLDSLCYKWWPFWVLCLEFWKITSWFWNLWLWKTVIWVWWRTPAGTTGPHCKLLIILVRKLPCCFSHPGLLRPCWLDHTCGLLLEYYSRPLCWFRFATWVHSIIQYMINMHWPLWKCMFWERDISVVTLNICMILCHLLLLQQYNGSKYLYCLQGDVSYLDQKNNALQSQDWYQLFNLQHTKAHKHTAAHRFYYLVLWVLCCYGVMF